MTRKPRTSGLLFTTAFALLGIVSTGACRAAAVVIEDFEDVSDWTVSAGPGAGTPNSIVTDGDAQVGSFSGLFTHSHTTAVGFDFVFFTKSVSLDLTNTEIDLWFKAPAAQGGDVIQLRFADSGSGFIEYDFSAAQRDGAWKHLTLGLGAFNDFGSGPDLTNIVTVQFRGLGDATAIDYTELFRVDHLQTLAVPTPAALPGALAMLGLFAARRRRRN